MHLVGVPLQSEDGSKKYRIGLDDGRGVEAVFLREKQAFGICLSTQVGCSMECKFCATALQRLERNLTAEEICDQATLVAKANQSDLPFEYVTLAGMGEPLINYKNSVTALDHLTTTFQLREASLSTVGVRGGLRRLVKEKRAFRLYLSLHATTDETRRKLIPTTRHTSIDELVDLVSEYGALNVPGKARVSYLLLKGINDSDADLDRLCTLLRDRPLVVQVLLWNEVTGAAFMRVKDSDAIRWANYLQARGVDAYAMPSFGRSVGAGCGQLITLASYRPVPHTAGALGVA